MPFVIFNKHCDPDTSWCDEVVNVMRPNVLGNPFQLGKNPSPRVREIVIRQYREYLIKQLNNRLLTKDRRLKPIPAEIARLHRLHLEGKTIALICCCAPKYCHAEVIVEICSK